MKQITIEEVIEQVIEKEEYSFGFYKHLRDVVLDKASQDVLDGIVEEELQHKELLQQYAEGKLGEEVLPLQALVDELVVTALRYSEITEIGDHKDIFLVAAEQEKASYQFYSRFADLQPEGTLKKRLYAVAKDELAHKEKAENLYRTAVFPQADA